MDGSQSIWPPPGAILREMVNLAPNGRQTHACCSFWLSVTGRRNARERHALLDSGGGGRATRIVVFTPFYPPAFMGGGPIRTLDSLVGSAPPDVCVTVVTGDRDLGATGRLRVSANRWSLRAGVGCYYVSVDKPLEVMRAVAAVARWTPDILYLNSFFSPTFAILPQVLRRLGWCSQARVLLAPRGEFNDGALRLKGRKKGLYVAVFKLMGLDRDVTWHGSTGEEGKAIWSTIRKSAQVIVREDETDLPAQATPPPAPKSTRLRIIFLSRICPIKGLRTLVDALVGAAGNIDLDVFGPETDVTYAKSCRAVLARLPPNVTVRFLGPVEPTSARATFSGYDAFAFPTRGENFGHVIAESLSASCPVICTDRTPWTSRLRSGGGVVVEDAESNVAWTRELDLYSKLSPEERLGRRLKAGIAYGAWMRERKPEHVFSVVRGINNDGSKQNEGKL